VNQFLFIWRQKCRTLNYRVAPPPVSFGFSLNEQVHLRSFMIHNNCSCSVTGLNGVDEGQVANLLYEKQILLLWLFQLLIEFFCKCGRLPIKIWHTKDRNASWTNSFLKLELIQRISNERSWKIRAERILKIRPKSKNAKNTR